MTPSRMIIANAQKISHVKDTLGRTLTIRQIQALDRLRLLKAAGAELSQNDAWLNVAALAISVIEIDGTPRAAPVNERQIEMAVSELGDAGLEAVAKALNDQKNESFLFEGTPEGNSEGTLP